MTKSEMECTNKKIPAKIQGRSGRSVQLRPKRPIGAEIGSFRSERPKLVRFGQPPTRFSFLLSITPLTMSYPTYIKGIIVILLPMPFLVRIVRKNTYF